MSEGLAATYIRENFEPTDRLAVVLLNRRTAAVLQRVAAAEKIANPDFQAWLRHKNAQHCEVYISMNALTEGARGRTKEDVNVIRHVYLDIDEDGNAAVERLFRREDLPQPNYLVNSSPDKWQVIWKVEGFTKDQAEELQKGLVHETGADPAATDCSRVLRLPGFYNHKYAQRYLVRAESRSTEIYRPEQFPRFPADDRGQRRVAGTRDASTRKGSPGRITQSERDWAFAKRALARGESEAEVVNVIAAHRQDKHNPQYYAELTVRKAAQSLSVEIPCSGASLQEPDR